jgi:hypothetical protein
MLRIVKIVLTATVATFGFLSGIFDLIHWSNTVGAVGMVTSMTSCKAAPLAGRPSAAHR